MHTVKPLVIITGAAGDIGCALLTALRDAYRIAGLDGPGTDCDIEVDITSDASVTLACSP